MQDLLARLRRQNRRMRGSNVRLMALYITNSVVESPIALLLVAAGSRSNAMTVSLFSELAHHPTSLWVSIAKSTYTHALVEEAGQFSLAVLTRSQREIAIACGTASGRDRDKCADLELYRTPGGFLYLNDALACSACRVTERIPLDSHTLFLAAILEGEVESRSSGQRHLLSSDL